MTGTVSIRCPKCNRFILQLDGVEFDTKDPTLTLKIHTSFRCGHCKEKHRRVIDAFLPKIGGVVNRK